jgi:SAM-dependent methyltransferase
MLTRDLLAFMRASLPEPPRRVLEIGAGRGELAAALRDAGYDVTAIDPAAEPESGVEPLALLEAGGSFDAAVAVVSLHHVDPLEASCAHLADLIAPGGRLVIDELDIGRYDVRAVEWWLAQRRALGADETHGRDAVELLGHLVAHLHPLERICAALRPWFEVGEPVRGPCLHRWELRPSLRDAEVELIAEGRLPATGARLVAVRKSRPLTGSLPK